MVKETQQRLIDALQLLKEPKGSTISSIVLTVNEKEPKISLKNILQELSGCMKSGIMTQRNGRIRLKQATVGAKNSNYRSAKTVAFLPGKNPEPKSPSQTSLCAKPKPRNPRSRRSRPRGRCPRSKPRCPRSKPRCPRSRSKRTKSRSSRSRARCRKQKPRRRSRSKQRSSRRKPRCPRMKPKRCSFIGE